MARKTIKPRLHETGSIITTKTAYGSTSDMIVNIENYISDSNISLKDDEVVCKDDKGFYITSKNRIDSGIADPNRYANQKNRINLKEKENSST